MDSALIPIFIASRVAAKPYELRYSQLHLKALSKIDLLGSNTLHILVGQPNGIVVSSDLGVFNQMGGEHEHSGSIVIQNLTNDDQLVTFVVIMSL